MYTRTGLRARSAMVCTSQPLATEIGIKILKSGGNAADASVAVAAALNVIEPCSTGIGGDCFALFYDAKAKCVKGLNGSGRSSKELSLEKLNSLGFNEQKPWGTYSALTVTVPGAAAGWVDTISNFGSGKLSLQEILQPAIQLATNGFTVVPNTSYYWNNATPEQKRRMNNTSFFPNGEGPKPDKSFTNPDLARTFDELAKNGKDGFYKGRIAEAIVAAIKEEGGLLTLADLSSHTSTFVDPIHVNYRGYDIHEIPPNGQGITALIAFNILENFDISQYKFGSPDHLHLAIESLRLAFGDTRYFVADMEKVKVPVETLLSKEYAKNRAKSISVGKALQDITHGFPESSSCTVCFSIVDSDGNACSFINSNYMGFGTGIVPKNCGFTLQNRGFNFSLDPKHPNVVAPEKRPYHTIIPGMITKNGNLVAPFGVMGGFMQPQGHVQVVSNMLDFGMSPQEAINAPRWCIGDGTSGGQVSFETGISTDVISELKNRGHKVLDVPLTGFDVSLFGRGQIIRVEPDGSLIGGSEGRCDGIGLGY